MKNRLGGAWLRSSPRSRSTGDDAPGEINLLLTRIIDLAHGTGWHWEDSVPVAPSVFMPIGFAAVSVRQRFG